MRACFPGLITLLWAGPTFASGREGAAVAEAVVIIILAVLAAFAATIVAGVCWGGYQAGKKGESVLRGGATGIWKGFLWFLVLAAVSWAGLTILGLLFAAYALWSTGTFGELWNILLEAWNGK